MIITKTNNRKPRSQVEVLRAGKTSRPRGHFLNDSQSAECASIQKSIRSAAHNRKME